MTIQHDLANQFKPLEISALVSEKFHFIIPSYQRGYRWGEREVQDLLEDLQGFVQADSPYYYLQPIVVRPTQETQERTKWEVLDGQQRLTTLLLIVKRLLKRLPEEDRDSLQKNIYTIEYTNRKNLDFDNPDQRANLDEYHVFKAKEIINRWVEEKRKAGNLRLLNNICEVLFSRDSKKQVCFIWYPIQADSNVKESISLFNRLNQGKIKLSGSELIKALFILSHKKNGENAVARFAFEWDEIVRKLENDTFWFFISDEQNVQTRMDKLFTFITNKSNDEDAYREFQKSYDEFALGKENVKVFDGKTYNNFSSLWKIVTRGFDDLVRWYEDIKAYNYIGWLVRNNCPLRYIKREWDEATPLNNSNVITNEDHYRQLREIIKKKIGYINKDTLAGLTYSDNYKLVKNILLLFNVESATDQRKRFPFERYAHEKITWDVEHVDSQEDNNLQKPEDKIMWLNFVLETLSWMPKTQEGVTTLTDEGEKLRNILNETKTDKGNQFNSYYSKIGHFFSGLNSRDETTDAQETKDSINNLTLLDSGTNRSYQNAPFPHKRYRIIMRDKAGDFVPECTLKLFLKYYSDTEKCSQQLDLFRWSATDREKYFDAICKTLHPFIEEK